VKLALPDALLVAVPAELPESTDEQSKQAR
jgi:hypothetical protein